MGFTCDMCNGKLLLDEAGNASCIDCGAVYTVATMRKKYYPTNTNSFATESIKNNVPVEDVSKPGTIIKGKVTAIRDFGVFVEFYKGCEGLIHISKICPKRLDKPSDLLSMGDELWCICTGRDGMGRCAYSSKDAAVIEKNIELLPLTSTGIPTKRSFHSKMERQKQ